MASVVTACHARDTPAGRWKSSSSRRGSVIACNILIINISITLVRKRQTSRRSVLLIRRGGNLIVSVCLGVCLFVCP